MIHKEDNEMKFKKVAALVLASAMTLGLAACGNGNSSTPSQSSGGASSSGTTSSSATEISLWAFNIGGFTEASNWDSLIAAFNEVNPDIKVTVTPINYQDGDQKLTSAITSGSGPDIIFEGPERIVGNYAREGLMVDLSDLWEANGSDIAEGISSVSQLDGTYYMYFSGLERYTAHPPNKIYLATSKDGVNFTVYGAVVDVPKLGLGYGAGSPSVIYKDGKYYLYYYTQSPSNDYPNEPIGSFSRYPQICSLFS